MYSMYFRTMYQANWRGGVLESYQNSILSICKRRIRPQGGGMSGGRNRKWLGAMYTNSDKLGIVVVLTRSSGSRSWDDNGPLKGFRGSGELEYLVLDFRISKQLANPLADQFSRKRFNASRTRTIHFRLWKSFRFWRHKLNTKNKTRDIQFLYLMYNSIFKSFLKSLKFKNISLSLFLSLFCFSRKYHKIILLTLFIVASSHIQRREHRET